MKTIIVLVLTQVAAMAQTNLIVVTNSHGERITARVVSVDASKLVYRNEDGTMAGMIKLSSLPAAEQKRFGYDPERAKLAEQREAEKRASYARSESAARESQANKKAREDRVKQLADEARGIWGVVIQNVKDGGKAAILVDGDSYRRAEGTSYGVEGNIHDFWPRRGERIKTTGFADGTFLLTDLPGTLADGEKFKAVGYPTGFYEYTTVTGARTKVRKYSASLASAAAQLP